MEILEENLPLPAVEPVHPESEHQKLHRLLGGDHPLVELECEEAVAEEETGKVRAVGETRPADKVEFLDGENLQLGGEVVAGGETEDKVRVLLVL